MTQEFKIIVKNGSLRNIMMTKNVLKKEGYSYEQCDSWFNKGQSELS